MDNYNYNKIVVDMKTLSQKQVKSKLFGKETFLGNSYVEM